jgi:hypothetical protein
LMLHDEKPRSVKLKMIGPSRKRLRKISPMCQWLPMDAANHTHVIRASPGMPMEEFR